MLEKFIIYFFLVLPAVVSIGVGVAGVVVQISKSIASFLG